MSDPFTSPRQGRRAPAEPVVEKAAPAAAEAPKVLPQGFVFESEHPVLPIPFKVSIGELRLDGAEISVAAAYVTIEGALDPAWVGHREVVKLQFDFKGFSITIFPDTVIAGSRRDGEMTLQFMDPTGEHLPQLRYILNNFIAGDFATIGGMLSYSGPTQPKAPKSVDNTASKFRVRSAAVGFLSVCVILTAGYVLTNRLTQSFEPRPVFIERLGKEMKATTAGQVSYLNPNAKAGEVVFSINANSGDVLNFKLPCDCEVTVTEGVFEGATVLPIDAILSFFDSSVEVRVQTQMSLEGMTKVMSGEQAFLDINDGRSIPVRVVMTSATNAASLRGDLFVPVTLVPVNGDLTQEDIGKTARLRLSRSWFGGSSANTLERT